MEVRGLLGCEGEGCVRYPSLFERLLANSTTPEAANGCWEWVGSRSTSSYGTVSMREPGRRTPRSVFAHRAMEQALRDAEAQRASDDAQPAWGPLPTVVAPPLCPESETLDHLCCFKRCVCPDHWQPVSRAENSSRMQARKHR